MEEKIVNNVLYRKSEYGEIRCLTERRAVRRSEDRKERGRSNGPRLYKEARTGRGSVLCNDPSEQHTLRGYAHPFFLQGRLLSQSFITVRIFSLAKRLLFTAACLGVEANI